MSTPGNRLLHTSRPLSSPVANRPLSPHLPLKKPQFSATFSISHRIFGVALGVAIISVPLATKFSLMFGVWEWFAASYEKQHFPFLWLSSSGLPCNTTVGAVGITSLSCWQSSVIISKTIKCQCKELAKSPGPGFEAVSLHNFCGGKTLFRLFPSPDPTRVGASGTGPALFKEICPIMDVHFS
jgi:hypothetical protein